MPAQLPNDLTQDIRKRIKVIKGQLEGMTQMLEAESPPDQILHQLKAAQKGLDKAHYKLLDEVYRKALAIKIVEANEACPGNCGNEEKIQYIKKEFPNFQMEEVTEKLEEMQDIAARLERYKEKEDD